MKTQPREGPARSDLLTTSSRGLAIMLSALLAAVPAAAASGVWESVGPRGGRVEALAVDPTDADRLYALQEGALVRSTDGGLTWLPGLALELEEVLAVAVAPSEPDVVYAGSRQGSVFRSLDGGVTWTETGTPDAPVVGVLAVDPTDAERVLAGGALDLIVLTTDGGASWSRIDLGRDRSAVVAFAFDPVAAATVYAATGAAYLRSLDGGASWTKVLETRRVPQDLEAHPFDSGTLFAATHRGVETSTDGGQTWSRLGGQGGPRLATAVAVDRQDPRRIFAGGRHNEGLWRTSDGGATWTLDADPLLTRGFVSEISLPKGPPSTLYLVTNAGVVASPDDGATWRLRTPRGAGLAVFDLLALESGPRRLYAGTAEGLFVSADDGGSWSFLPGAGSTWVQTLDADSSPRPRLFAGTPLQTLASDDGGGSWQDVTPEGGSSQLVVVDRVRPETVYSWNDSGISRSRDRGESWTFMAAEENSCFDALVPHPTIADALFGAASCCIISEGEPCGGVWASFDGWATREEIRWGGGDLAVQPPETLFVTDSHGVHRSTDLGATWQLVSDELGDLGASYLLVDPADPAVIFAVVDRRSRVALSEDGGESWRFLEADPPPGVVITDLAIDPRRPEYLFAATADQSVYRFQRREVSGPPEPPAGDWLESAALDGFRVKVRITAPSGEQPPVRREAACIPETLCVSGALPGRSEVFVRIVGPKPNGYLWPTLVKFSTSTVEVWIEQLSTGVVRYYRLEGASPGVDTLPGLFDRTGFLP